ncbi:hypothetical protein TraAM80_02387 [Trypanosoma rangeli]|uniref:Uncharacterized protein n=1 Tax=Trypanosoma rangeli TaxID=5698 RepID=A0A3R7KT24_TRYRA|nr:uncharacterized protein TraAM80_02387 [Trypanosoma rangeli]RNF09128.1 hypothetical protein TraAM80_02387 [Trypanosoma rangeli]|eukprot:RNF09128.1 hypothetical protein TraAM80_02387 [Trypanosoma rangeli]
MLRLLVACGRSEVGGGNDQFRTLQLLARMLGDEAAPALHEEEGGSSTPVTAAENTTSMAPRSSQHEPRNSLDRGAADTSTTVSMAPVGGDSHLNAPSSKGKYEPQGSTEANFDFVPPPTSAPPRFRDVMADKLTKGMDPSPLEHTIAFLSKSTSPLCSRRSSTVELGCPPVSRLPPVVVEPSPHDTAPAKPEGVDVPPRPARLTSLFNSAELGARVSYARRYLERLYFRDPVVVGPADDHLPPRIPMMRGPRKNPVFERCYYDTANLISTPAVLNGQRPASRVESKKLRSSLLDCNGAVAHGGGPGKSNSKPPSRSVSALAQQRITSAHRWKNQTRYARDLRQPVGPQTRRLTQEKLQQDDGTSGLHIEGRSLMIPGRPASALVRQFRRNKEMPRGRN